MRHPSAKNQKRDTGWTKYAAGVILGVGLTLVLLGVGYSCGVNARPANENAPDWLPLFAASADSADDVVVATGRVADDVEGLFVLDGLSGDLQCTVFNPASNAFNTIFRKNVLPDLQLNATKNPRFLMVTGEVMGMRRGAQQVGASMVYVVEASSGRFAAYAIPWNRSAFMSGQAQQGPFILLQAGSIRTAAVRE